jgi:hypothetical protein
MMMPETIEFSTESERSGAWAIGCPVVFAHRTFQPLDCACRHPSTRACSAVLPVTSTSTPVTSRVLALSIGGTPRSAPSSCA